MLADGGSHFGVVMKLGKRNRRSESPPICAGGQAAHDESDDGISQCMETSVYRLCEVTGKYPPSQTAGPAGLNGVTYAGWHAAIEDCLVFADSQGAIKSWKLLSGSRPQLGGSPAPRDMASGCRSVAMVPIGCLHGGVPVGKRASLAR